MMIPVAVLRGMEIVSRAGVRHASPFQRRIPGHHRFRTESPKSHCRSGSNPKDCGKGRSPSFRRIRKRDSDARSPTIPRAVFRHLVSLIGFYAFGLIFLIPAVDPARPQESRRFETGGHDHEET
ncbi:MAG: hypothetical protein MZU97_10350 [Bacillus subtilis]|nr:hypothetical protein [Bacillus subtilis]